ncbi:helix-turn-helix domain-containing protein [Bradyrhizobium sp. vgs-9]|uniref:helix-turn-helix domain-containing protein n=1 Tax=Bradyrhizobium sp. vgs-9 TaxID=208389 RepID=UPI0035D50875
MAEAPNRIAEWRKKRGMTQQQLADAIGSHWITVSKLERGKMQLTHEWADKIGEALRVITPRLTYFDDKKTIIYVQGIISNGESHGLKSKEDLPLEIRTNQRDQVGDFWCIVGDDSLYPVFRLGDALLLTICSGLDDDPYENYLDSLCLIRPKGVERHIIAILDRARAKGKFTAKPLNGPPIKDFEIEILAVVQQAFFAPKLTRELIKELEQASKHSRSAK